MANPEHLEILKQGAEAWNRWRQENPTVEIDFYEAKLFRANLRNVNLSEARLSRADFYNADLRGANLQGARVRRAKLEKANLNNADLRKADFRKADFREADLSDAKLRDANLEQAQLVGANLERADLTNCFIYGISAWNVKLEGANQTNLIIAPPNEPMITLDNLEVAQFIYLLINNKKIRDVINTIGKKAVLILGRFTPERKEILDSLAEALRQRGFLPIIFDFEGSHERDFTETVKILAGLSLFVIADMTNPKSNPLELQATVPDYMIPFVPIIQEGENPFSMFIDLQQKYDWVMPVLEYDTKENLLATIGDAIIGPAVKKHDELVEKKTESLKVHNVKDFLSKGNV